MTPFLWFVLLAIAIGVEARLPEPPLGLDLYMPVPEDNPLVRGKVVLGRRLFFDRRLSRERHARLRELPRSGSRLL